MRAKIMAVAAVAVAGIVPSLGSAATISNPSTLNILYGFTYDSSGRLSRTNDLTASNPVVVVEHTGSFAGADDGTVSNLIGDVYTDLNPTGTSFNYTTTGGDIFTLTFDDFDLVSFSDGNTQSWNATGHMTLTSTGFDTVVGEYSLGGSHADSAVHGSITLSNFFSVAAVPLPASALTLLTAIGALGGLGYLSRRRMVAAI